MSKDLFLRLAVVAGLAMVAGGMLSGCEEPLVTPDPPTAELTLKSAGATDAVLVLKTSSISEYAWAVYSETPGTAPTADVLFMSGTVGNCVDGDNEFTVSGLEGNTDYTLYLAAKTVEDEYYQEILSAVITTTDYTEPLTVVEANYDGFRIHVNVPESVTSAGNALRYLVTDLFSYNMNKNGFFGVTPDAEFMASNGGLEYYIDKSQTLAFDNSEEQLYLHNFFVPGSPVVFKVGEFAWGESWSGEGYITPLFDYDGFMTDPDALANEADYWTGYHAETVVYLREPEPLDAKVDVQLDIQAVKGTITLTPQEGVYQYCVFVLDQATYDTMLGWLDNDESNLQWFVTTEQAFMNGARSLSGNQVLKLEDLYYDVPEDSHYHLLITSMGNEEGTSQSFQHLEFDTTPKTLEAPEITVTPVGGEVSSDPFSVTFNIKSTGSVPVTSAAYNANYESEWAGLLAYMDYSQILSSYGNAFSAAEVELINSEEGYDVTFNSVDGMATRLAVIGYNDENTPNVIEDGGPAVAVQTTPYQPADEKVDSPLFSELAGEWTMSAEVSEYDYYEGGYSSLGTRTAKVTIYNGLDDFPATLPEDVYANYPDMTTEEVDALYEEFKLEAEAFNEKVRGQNRLLCVGFGFEEEGSPYPLFSSQTPYELFCNPDYSGYDVASLFYDFGPKWYIEVAADGTVTAPFNSVTMSPLTAWTYNGAYYLAGNNPDAGYLTYYYDGEGIVDATFPVEVADDNATVVVSPFMATPDGYDEPVPFYPNAVAPSTYGASLGGYRIDTGLTLTKGWTGDDAGTSVPSSVRGGNAASAPVFSPLYSGVRSVPAARPKSRTVVPESAKVKYEEVEIEVLTIDKFNEYLNSHRQSESR